MRILLWIEMGKKGFVFSPLFKVESSMMEDRLLLLVDIVTKDVFGVVASIDSTGHQHHGRIYDGREQPARIWDLLHYLSNRKALCEGLARIGHNSPSHLHLSLSINDEINFCVVIVHLACSIIKLCSNNACGWRLKVSGICGLHTLVDVRDFEHCSLVKCGGVPKALWWCDSGRTALLCVRVKAVADLPNLIHVWLGILYIYICVWNLESCCILSAGCCVILMTIIMWG